MGSRLLAVILISGLLAACNPSLEDKRDGRAAPAANADPAAANKPPTTGEAPLPPPPQQSTPGRTTTVEKTLTVPPPKPVQATKPVAPQVQPPPPPPLLTDPTDEQLNSPLLTQGHLDEQIPEYQVPEKVRQRLEQFQPELLAPKSADFTIVNQNLNIDAKSKTVTFRGSLRVKGKNEEPFELACKIDTSSVPWVCRDMTPTNPKLAAQKRFQGTFKCLDAYVCDNVGVALWVVIDGKLQEPKLFQAHGFRIRKVSLDDDDDDLADSIEKLAPKIQDRLPQEPDAKNQKATKPAKEDDKISIPMPKPRPTEPPPVTIQRPPVQVQPIQPPPPELNDDEINEALDNDESLEISEPMSMPQPEVGKYSVPGIEKLKPVMGNGVKIQAVGWHASGYLKAAAEFPASGPGFVSRDHGSKDFGTDMTVSLLTQAFAQVEQKYPGRAPIVLGSVANRTGGKLINLSGHAHASHQTGLDADVGLPSSRPTNQFFSACGPQGCSRNKNVTSAFDVERFWIFIKQLSCAENKPVIAMFLDREIKKDVCNYVKHTAQENMNDQCVVRALQALRHLQGHDNHVHIRLRCPEGSACQNSWVTLANGAGC